MLVTCGPQAQAQEIFWHKAVLGWMPRVCAAALTCRPEKKSNAAIAKVAMQAADFYEVAFKELSRPEIDRAWTALATQKKLFFTADAQFRAAQQSLEAEQYGEWVARLRFADAQLKQIASKGGQLEPRIFAAQVAKELDKAEKENAGIYLKVVPAFETFVPSSFEHARGNRSAGCRSWKSWRRPQTRKASPPGTRQTCWAKTFSASWCHWSACTGV